MKKVINVQKSISPEIYTVKTIDGRTSSYTPNHRCVVGVFDKETCNIHIEEVLAKNLNKYMYAIVIKNDRYMFDRIVSIDHVEKDTDVYCLEVDDGLYFADGILTHNSIFSFKGGDVNIFLSLMHNEEWQPYFLTENYRTARSILMYANSIVQNADDIIKKDVEFKNENVGSLEFNTKSQLEKFLSDLNPNDEWFILTRSNKEMSAIDSNARPIPTDMPGYTDQVIMASGSFTQGSSIEISCDGPIREPYIAYQQGSLTYTYGRLAVLNAVGKFYEN